MQQFSSFPIYYLCQKLTLLHKDLSKKSVKNKSNFKHLKFMKLTISFSEQKALSIFKKKKNIHKTHFPFAKIHSSFHSTRESSMFKQLLLPLWNNNHDLPKIGFTALLCLYSHNHPI